MAIAVQMGSLDITAEAAERGKRSREALTNYFDNVLVKGVDYGKTSKSKKPSLWKPGAEILARSLSLNGDTQLIESVEEHDTEKPYFFYKAECRIYNQAGGYLGNGFGSANTRETGYAFRWLRDNELPEGTKRDGLVTRQNWGKTEYRTTVTPDVTFTLANTVKKMAKKRAFIDAVLSVTGASRIFTQDMDDEDSQPEADEKAEEKATTAPTPAAAPTPSQEPVMLTRIRNDLKDFPDIKVVEGADWYGVSPGKGWGHEKLDALAAIMSTYAAKKVVDGDKLTFKVKK